MRTRSQSRNSNRQQQQQLPPTFVEPFNLVKPIENSAPPIVTMADNRTMTQLLEAPTEGYEDAIVVPEITTDNFKLKHDLLTLGVSKTDFESYVKANDVVMQNMQSQMSNITYLLTKIANSNAASTSGSGSLPRNTVANPKGELKAITTRSGASYDGPQVPPPTSSLPKVVENEPEVTKDTMPSTNNGSTKDVQPPVVQVQPQVPNSEPVVAPVSAPKPNPKPSIPYPLRRNNERRREKANDQIEKFYEIFKDLSFKISLTDTLILTDICVIQPPAYQAPPYQAPTPQTQGVTKTDFESYVKANDAVMRNMQDQSNRQNQMTNLTDMLSKFVNANTASSSGTGSLPSNTVTNPKEDLNGITTRSGVAYRGPMIPTTSSCPSKVVKRETEVTKDTVPPTNNG
ncbi:hypothetical protein Tco_0105071 [Tanacetum coccineum]